jgi:formylglycine-generating enzyme required for sulfatase activity
LYWDAPNSTTYPLARQIIGKHGVKTDGKITFSLAPDVLKAFLADVSQKQQAHGTQRLFFGINYCDSYHLEDNDLPRIEFHMKTGLLGFLNNPPMLEFDLSYADSIAFAMDELMVQSFSTMLQEQSPLEATSNSQFPNENAGMYAHGYSKSAVTEFGLLSAFVPQMTAAEEAHQENRISRRTLTRQSEHTKTIRVHIELEPVLADTKYGILVEELPYGALLEQTHCQGVFRDYLLPGNRIAFLINPFDSADNIEISYTIRLPLHHQPDRVTGTFHYCDTNDVYRTSLVTETPFSVSVFDLNQDGVVDQEDALILWRWLRSGDPQADFNGDGKVDAQDLLLFSRHWMDDVRVTARESAAPDELTIPLPGLPAGAIPLTMVRIPSGSFIMGTPEDEEGRWDDESPQRQVNINYDFYMGKYTVTKAQWQAVMGTTPWSGQSFVLDDPNSPAVYVTWNDTKAFITALNQLGQGTFRLPSEAEWEYAARAGTNTRFYFGDSICAPTACISCDLDDYAWWCGNSDQRFLEEVGQLIPNDFGLYDMHGSMFEWCEDDFLYDGYEGAPNDGSPYISSPRGPFRSLRGGSYVSQTRDNRSSARGSNSPDTVAGNFGVRLVLESGN